MRSGFFQSVLPHLWGEKDTGFFLTEFSFLLTKKLHFGAPFAKREEVVNLAFNVGMHEC